VLFNGDNFCFYVRSNPLAGDASLNFPLYLNVGIFTTRPCYTWQRTA
jgi:hypothetical protein